MAVDAVADRRDDQPMRVGTEASRLPAGSTWLVDDRGLAMKATWRLSHGFINLSLWRDDRCVETFHLAPVDAARLVTFLVEGLAEVATVPPAAPVVSLVGPPAAPRRTVRDRIDRADDRLRTSLARSLRRAADRLGG